MTCEKTIFLRIIIIIKQTDCFSFLLTGKGSSLEIFTWAPYYQVAPMVRAKNFHEKKSQNCLVFQLSDFENFYFLLVIRVLHTGRIFYFIAKHKIHTKIKTL